MEVTSLCLIISATLSVRPDRSQFFHFEDISLTCTAPADTGGWTLRRSGSEAPPPPCQPNCSLTDVFPDDGGLYWCESARGECSNTVNVTVKVGVILESPVLPVTAGESVTLRCSFKLRFEKRSTSDFPAAFYKDGVFVGRGGGGGGGGGQMILPAASESDSGFYSCEHPAKGKSPESRLLVRARPDSSAPPPPPRMSPLKLACSVLLFVLYTGVLVLSVVVHRRWARARAQHRDSALD